MLADKAKQRSASGHLDRPHKPWHRCWVPKLPTLPDLPDLPGGGPVAVMLVEDLAALDATAIALAATGFADIVAVGEGDWPLPEAPARCHRAEASLRSPADIATALTAALQAYAGRWVYWSFNAEWLIFPFCETRRVADMLAFVDEERRASVWGITLDLYPSDLGAAPDGVDLAGAAFDATGYYSLQRYDGPEVQDRQIDVLGGLRWRLERHLPWARRRLDRIPLIKPPPGLTVDADLRLSEPELNTIACPWHNNLTVAVASFRVAKALRRNPASRAQIDGFAWEGSRRFDWTSRQLLDAGLIEPGQWF